MVKLIKGIVATCKLIIWNNKYKMLDTEIRIKTLDMQNKGLELALYLYENKSILDYVKGQVEYREEFNNLLEFLRNDDKCRELVKTLK